MPEESIITNLDDLLSVPDFDRLSIGIRPSGYIHLGSVITFMSALNYVDKYPESMARIHIMDLDFDFQRGNEFTPYIYQNTEENITVRQALQEDLLEAFDVLQEFYPNMRVLREPNVSIEYFSEFLFKRNVLDFMTNILADEALVRKMNYELFDNELNGKPPISGICPVCYTSTTSFAERMFSPGDIESLYEKLGEHEDNKFNLPQETNQRMINEFEEKIEDLEQRIDFWTGGDVDQMPFIMRSECTTSGCIAGDRYGFDIRGDLYNIHYLVDPIRDGLDAEDIHQVHIFGGDYAFPHGTRKITRVERVRNGMEAVGLPPIHFYVGPLVTMGDKKMGKSSDSVVHFNELGYLDQKRVIHYFAEQLEQRKETIDWQEASGRVLG